MPRSLIPLSGSGARTAVSNRVRLRDSGTCLYFNGTNASVSKSSLTGGTAMNTTWSFSVWINLHLVRTTMAILSFEGSGGSQTALYLRSSKIAISKSGGSSLISSPSVPQTFRWVLVTYTFDGTNNRLYLNGTSATSSTTTAPNTGTLDYVKAGNWSGSSDPYFVGYMDEVIYLPGVLLSDADVSNLYFSGIDALPTGAKLIWKFDEGSGTSAIDFTGTQGNGTISNATYATQKIFALRTLSS